MTEVKKNKLFILDTNVLIVDPSCIFKFDKNDVGIPMTVLEELDNIKSGERTISRDARVAVRNIAGLVEDGDFQKGVEIPDGGNLFVITDKVSNDLDESVNDNQIINHALHMQENNLATNYWSEVVLVTNDINMRVKSNAAGVENVQSYQSDQVVDDVKFLNKGWERVAEGWLESLPIEELEYKSCGGVVIPIKYFPESITLDNAINTWVFDDEDFVAMINEVYEHETDLSLSKLGIVVKSRKGMMKRSCVGIKPRSIQQAIAIDSLLDRDLDVVILFGQAGSGKSLVTIAGAAEMCVGKKKGYRYNEVVYTKTPDSQFKEEGFLPGGIFEKLAPNAGPLFDNLEVIARESKRKELHPLAAANPEEGFIQLKSFNHMRGRSLNNRVFVIDECQNLNTSQMKTLLSRAGEDCKVILMGNLSQIDNDFLSANNSGLTYICEKFQTWERASIVHLESIERSPLAEFVEENFI